MLSFKEMLNRSFTALPGLKTTISEVTVGSGKEIKTGAMCTVHATGMVVETMQKFWSTHDQGQSPFGWNAGMGQVITGWDKGVVGMKEGGVRVLKIVPEEGYGAGGFPAWGIPPKATLLFLIECQKVE